ncbi:hypothetical protein [Micromonospora taraxaci]|uniref:hypothetical protein n=1 Tax=Micromonospora taraxaci TaxID=1316803 RepID=UPI0033B311BF
MARLILTLAAIALLVAVSVYAGEVIGERREHARLAAEFRVLRHEVLTTHAALMAMPLPLPESVEHRQAVALEHHARWAPVLADLAAHFTHRRAA